MNEWRGEIGLGDDYYPGGMLQTGRTFSSPSYRYGFQGHEKDDEVKGDGNHLSFGDFGYDSRIGRRWNIDPIYKPWLSNYLTFGNNPINYIDPSGGDWYRVNGTSKVVWIESDGQDFKGYTYLGEFRHSTNWSTDYNRYGSKYQRYIYWNFLGRGTKGTKLLFDGLAIAGGIVTIATLGAASPIVASLSIISGSFSVAGGITTLTLHLANADELADKVPKGYFDAIIGVTLEYTVDGEKYSDEIEVTRSALNLGESLLSLDFKEVPVNLMEASDFTITSIRVGKDAVDTWNKTGDSGKTDDDKKAKPKKMKKMKF